MRLCRRCVGYGGTSRRRRNHYSRQHPPQCEVGPSRGSKPNRETSIFFCDHVEVLIRARFLDRQTFTLLTDPQSILAIGLPFKTHKAMEQKPVAWEIATILEALKECYPSLRWATSSAPTRSSTSCTNRSTRQSSGCFTSFADIGDMPVEHEVTLLSKFSKVLTYFHNPHKDWGRSKPTSRMLSRRIRPTQPSLR